MAPSGDLCRVSPTKKASQKKTVSRKRKPGETGTNLVGVLAWGRDLDAATPVEVEVAKLICQVLQDCTVKVRCVVANEEMGGQNATLSGSLTDQEEVIEISSLVTNKVAINNRTTWWIFDWKIRRFNLCISNT